MNKELIVKTLTSNRPEIIKRLNDVIAHNTFNYRTFGTSIEDPLFDIVIDILKKNKIITAEEQFKRAKDKNEFPDLTIKTDPLFALEAKAGNKSELTAGNIWKPCKNSANDLGTLNMWEKKLSQFNGDNIYFIFIEYDFTDKHKQIVDVKINVFYKFIGLNKAKLLSYREKDGNLRPKDFDAPSPITSLKQFMDLLPRTNAYRSRRLVEKHLKGLTPDVVKELLEKTLGSK